MLGQEIGVQSCASWAVTVQLAWVLEVRSHRKYLTRPTKRSNTISET